MFDGNDDVCSLCEARVCTNSVAGSAGDGGSPSNLKAAVIGYLTACAHLLSKSAEFGAASASVGHLKPLRENCPLFGEYVKPALLDIKSGYNDSTQDLPRRNKLNGRYSGLSTKVKSLISSLLENMKASTAGNPIKRFVYTTPSVPI